MGVQFRRFRLSDGVACAAVVQLLDDVHVGRDRRPDVRAQDFQVRASACVLCVCMPCDVTACNVLCAMLCVLRCDEMLCNELFCDTKWWGVL